MRDVVVPRSGAMSVSRPLGRPSTSTNRKVETAIATRMTFARRGSTMPGAAGGVTVTRVSGRDESGARASSTAQHRPVPDAEEPPVPTTTATIDVPGAVVTYDVHEPDAPSAVRP